MQTRILPFVEYHRLPDLALAALPEHAATVIVVEVEGQIVAHWAIMLCVHVEGLWVAPAYAKHVGVGRALLSAMVTELQSQGVREALTQATTPQVEALCEKAGGRPVPGTTWVLPIAQE